MSTLYNDATNDLTLDAKGRLELETDEVVAGAIKLKNRFQFFRNEWFLDTRIGIPYYQLIFVKNPDLQLIKSIFSEVILSIESIASLDQIDVYFLPAERKLLLEFTATAADGRTITGGGGDAFIITVGDEVV